MWFELLKIKKFIKKEAVIRKEKPVCDDPSKDDASCTGACQEETKGTEMTGCCGGHCHAEEKRR